MKGGGRKRRETWGGQLEGIILIFAVALVICSLKIMVHSFPSLSGCDVPALSSEHDGSVVLELAGDTKKRGIYYVPAGTSVGQFLDMTGFPAATAIRDGKPGRVLSAGERLTVRGDGRERKAVTSGKMRSSTALALDQPIDLNGATVQDLMLIPGVGKKTAEGIAELREKRGKFLRVDELRAVSGIGEKTYERIKRHFYVACN